VGEREPRSTDSAHHHQHLSGNPRFEGSVQVITVGVRGVEYAGDILLGERADGGDALESSLGDAASVEEFVDVHHGTASRLLGMPASGQLDEIPGIIAVDRMLGSVNADRSTVGRVNSRIDTSAGGSYGSQARSARMAVRS
jgi:hypothetical protein